MFCIYSLKEIIHQNHHVFLMNSYDYPLFLRERKKRGEKEKFKRYYCLYGNVIRRNDVINWNVTWTESYMASSGADFHYIILAIAGPKPDDCPLQSHVTLVSWANCTWKVFFIDCQTKIHCHCKTEYYKSSFKSVPLSFTFSVTPLLRHHNLQAWN